MPVAYLVGLGGLAVVSGALLHYSVSNEWLALVVWAGLLLLGFPVLMVLFRLLRGHYSDALDEP